MKQGIKYYLAEGFLIVFSVLFALFINKIVADAQRASQKQIALSSIRQELELNRDILAEWLPRHTEIRDRLAEILQGNQDSLLQAMEQQPYFNLGLLTSGESLVEGLPTSTAWESAVSTGIVSEFSFKTTRTLTETYALQREITEISLRRVLDIYYQMDTHKPENLEPVLIQFQIAFWELCGQEYLMAEIYDNTLAYLEAEAPE